MKMDFAEEVCQKYKNKTKRDEALNQRMACDDECSLKLINGRDREENGNEGSKSNSAENTFSFSMVLYAAVMTILSRFMG